ncbi:hypothetical protein ABZS66_42485 [Dactylosporangium sp. NPDC005572]|uniref:hypothetical protein n=1 Tax=Dactylosporangium sp. NPDC005572 TaxID=3156889 RepID=UPI0033A6142F
MYQHILGAIGGAAALVATAAGTAALLGDDHDTRILVWAAATSVCTALVGGRWVVCGLTVLATALIATGLLSAGAGPALAAVGAGVTVLAALLGASQPVTVRAGRAPVRAGSGGGSPAR